MYQVFGYEYDVDDNLISRDYNAYYGNGQLQFSQQYTFVYDDDGNEIRNDYVSKEYYKNGQLRYEREIYDYMNGTFIHASADSNGVCTKCKDGFDDIDGYCNKIRRTPAEAAKVLRDDNTNEVTITFKK